ADDLPGRQARRLTVLAPQAQCHRRRVVQIAGLLPVADLRVVVGVAAGQQEGVVVGELLQRPADLLQRRLLAGDAEGDVPQAGQVLALASGDGVAGRDAGEPPFRAGRPGAGTTAGRRPRAHSPHVGLLRTPPVPERDTPSPRPAPGATGSRPQEALGATL